MHAKAVDGIQDSLMSKDGDDAASMNDFGTFSLAEGFRIEDMLPSHQSISRRYKPRKSNDTE
jgi:hypothetical protein